MKVSIDKELEKASAEKKQLQKLDPLSETKLLLAGDSQEDARILRGLSQNSQFNRVEKIRGEQLELEKLENDYEGKVYNIEQIKNLCVDYRLRFLQSQYYTGSYDVEVSAKIKEFAKNTNSPIDNFTLGRRYFIMAPAEMFELKSERYITKREKDPAIFFQIDDQHYRLIHKWGSDFTIFRLIEGFRWKTYWSHQWFNTFMMMPLMAILFFLLFDSPAAQLENHPILNSATIFTLSFIFAWVIFGWRKQDDFEAIKGYFSKFNWNSTSKIHR